jgi:hypothetical protein
MEPFKKKIAWCSMIELIFLLHNMVRFFLNQRSSKKSSNQIFFFYRSVTSLMLKKKHTVWFFFQPTRDLKKQWAILLHIKTDIITLEYSRYIFIFLLFKKAHGLDRRVKRQSRGPVRPSKSHTRHARPIPPGMKISPVLLEGQVFLAQLGPARRVMQCCFLKSAEKHIFLSILDYEFEKT